MEAVQQPVPEPQDASAAQPEPVPTEGSGEPAPEVAAGAEPPAVAPADEVASVLPVPVEVPPEKRSLWRRLTRRGEVRRADGTGFQDLVKSRLDGITLRLESFDHALTRTDARLEGRLELLERIEAAKTKLINVNTVLSTEVFLLLGENNEHTFTQKLFSVQLQSY